MAGAEGVDLGKSACCNHIVDLNDEVNTHFLPKRLWNPVIRGAQRAT